MRKIFLSFLLLAVNLCSGQVNLNQGLIAFYPFSGNANDVTTNNINGVVSNAVLTTDRFSNPNSAYYFNGSNSFIQLPYSPLYNFAPQDSFSISVRVLPDQGYSWPAQALVVKSPFTPDFNQSNWNYGEYILNYKAMTGYAANSVLVGNTVFTGTACWYNIIVTYKNGIWKLYVNGVLEASDLSQTKFILQDGPASKINFGKKGDANGDYFKGKMDDVRIYNRVLNVDEAIALTDCSTPTSCTNWLTTPNQNDYARIGDLDITGNQLTVEAVFNRATPLNSGIYYGHLISKHTNASNVNYALLPNGCEITTTNGYKATFQSCPPELNKTYHVAMVYDGINLKYYRNGFLLSQVACTGNMITNDLQTTIAQVAGGGFPPDNQFKGFANEVRIWNVARTQAQIQTYMNSSLPTPTTQTGLQGYYTFDDLTNKQGNAAFNATLNGAAAINATNPNCSFVADSCAALLCTNWLSTPTNPSTATIGNLNVTGNQITVEANFNCTSNTSSGVGFGGKLISKHTNAANTCYALSPHAAELSTVDNGYLVTYQTCPFVLNKTYHTAMVYDGASLKFYRDGVLMSQVPCSGNISTNNLLASIGNGPNSPLISQFFGHINEVRVWNVARTQAQLQTYMNTSLPNPTTQPGLLAYYTFDNLLNKQGNAAWNGTLNGGASINNTNPNCTFTPNPCAVVATSVIINDYSPVLALNICSNTLTVEDATAYNVGDTVLLIQMKGAVIDSTNTATFGTITDYKNSGNYEFNYVKNKAGNSIELKNILTRQYDIPVGKVQLIRVPYYSNLTTTDTLTCLPWDGNKGGVLAVNVQNTLTLNADINVSGKGFRGGQALTNIPGTGMYNQTDYAYPANLIDGARKGEGIAEVSENLIFCRGALASGGGGGNSSNAGGGGGGNGGAGGSGGNEWGGSPIVLTNGGVGGKSYIYSSSSNKNFMGGAGGAGHGNDASATSGGNGGGIVIIKTNTIIPNAKKIISNGLQGPDCLNISTCADGVAGGGAGGTIMINAQTVISNFQIQTNGGKGADNNIPGPNAHGPGGGGGGGTLLVNSAALLGNITYSSTGGMGGRALNHGNTNWGALNGSAGISAANYTIPNSVVPFQKNIDSVRIKDSLLACNGYNFKGLAYINTHPIVSWQWYFGDGGSATSQNTSHAYTTAGLYTVKLIVTDINGCIDSTLKDVNALPGVNAEAGADTSICTNETVTVMLSGTAIGGPYSWSPAIYLNNPNIQNPVATISSTTTFYLNVTGAASCTSVDSVTIYINPLPLVNTRSDTAICRFSTLVLTTNSNAATYQWSPAIYVSNATIANPNYIDNFSHRVYVTGTSALGCSATDSVDVTVNILPVVQTIIDTTVCIAQNITLTTTGAQTYLWSPAINLSNPNIASPVFSGAVGQTYTVTGTDANGCKNNDVVTIIISSPDSLKPPPSFAICQKQSILLNGNNGNRVSYLWSPATYLSNATLINPRANPPQTTLYTLLVTDNKCGFDSTFTTLLTILPAPVINTRKSNDVDCAFRSATLFASGGNQYLWSPSTGLSSTTIPNPVAKPTVTTKYMVTVTDATGCSNIDSVTIFINNNSSLARYMPNAFTPDGNGKNDCYGLKNWMYIQQLQFYIFNRFGEQVFATTNSNTCWDGTYKGKPALAGTYVYFIRAKTTCGLEEQKGSFLLIR